MRLASLMVAAVMVHDAPAPVDTTSYTIDALRRDLPSLVLVDSSKYGFSLNVDSIAPSRALSALVRVNRRYVLYLTTHAVTAPWDSVDLHGSRATVKARFLNALARDSQYLIVLAESVERLRRATRASAGGARAPRASPSRSVDVQRVQDVAARFFYPDEILANGHIQAHVCVAINGITDMQRGRDPALEAFAFAAIFEDLDHPRVDVDADFRQASRLINSMDLSTEPVVRLQRAQGVMWGEMVRSVRLRHVLSAGYDRARDYLSFRIGGWMRERGKGARE